MRVACQMAVLSVLALVAGGCKSSMKMSESVASLGDPFAAGAPMKSGKPAASDSVSGEGDGLPAARMLVWSASLDVEVGNVSNAVRQATDAAIKVGGYVERTDFSGESSARLTLRVPSTSLKATVGIVESLGRIVDKSIESEDVTEEYVDVDARLKNKIVLRDRLKQILDKAVDVKDILAIETELNRVQGDIDSMTARLKALKGRVDFSRIDVDFSRRRILGPLGYLLKGAWWGVEKLFVIRD